jgi:hypothetical protein
MHVLQLLILLLCGSHIEPNLQFSLVQSALHIKMQLLPLLLGIPQNAGSAHSTIAA